MNRRQFVGASASLLAASVLPASARDTPTQPAPELKVSPNRRYLVDQHARPFFLLGDTPWFVQHHKIDDVRLIFDDRRAKGFNTLFLELLDDSKIPSRDGYGQVAFAPEREITRPVEAYWDYAAKVLDEAAQRGFFVIVSELWFGAGPGLWMHHVTPEKARIYGDFLGQRFAKFRNLMWMHAGDRNPDANLLACTRILAERIRAAAPHHLHTAHLNHEFASAAFHHDDPWLDVNLGYTYGPAHSHILAEYRRKPPRPVILGETGYEDEPNAIHLLPDARAGDLWTPYRIRRNAWWAITSGAVGYCAGSRLWRWEKNWREVLNARSTREAPLLATALRELDWWKLVPDAEQAFLVAGAGDRKSGSYATAARADDGSCAVVYLPSSRAITLDLARLAPKPTAAWFDPTRGTRSEVKPTMEGTRGVFTPPGANAAGEPDWVLLLRGNGKS